MEFVSVEFSPITPEFEVWASQNPYFDPQALTYPGSALLVAKTAEKDLVYLVVQTAVFMEPSIINPEASKFEITTAYKSLLLACKLLAQKQGASQVFFVTANEPLAQVAEKAGMEKINEAIYSMESINGPKQRE